MAVERDVTALGPLFLASAEAALAVPNVVDETYTGAINLTATLSFYPPPPPPPPPTWQASLTSADAPSSSGASSDGRRRTTSCCRCGAATAATRSSGCASPATPT